MPSGENENLHVSVLLGETLEWLAPRPGETIVDATLGLGGHTLAILETGDTVRVIGIDQDRAAIAIATARLAKYKERLTIIHANFAGIKQVVPEKVDGIVADLGVSSLQFDSPERGFSFRFDAPLDMRMDPDSEDETAAELLERLNETEIADLIYRLGEERASRKIARRIVWKREIGEPVRTTRELAETVEKAIGKRPKDKIHPATRTFQALRIAVNGELEILEDFIADAIDLLKTGGRLAVITFHSLEDRIVKHSFQKFAGRCSCPPRLPHCVCGAERKVEILTRKPIVSGEIEIAENPRARSAKLRVCKKL
ncbi:MAG: 16S rRNA (cytosine(1402)-N(4))-methyltransferase RsmH [Acidobacteria bacterium]|nr:16S rRNA (cytosine(1402)-N(4))-methyltransferase RsmH [Acidobacteriota bacterium]MBK8147872.1 16S rRNA (cytosine(1402)-N(4))-methyltransferase RsmH [Acidobacteriota bacterium]MBK8812158.1 16S rRNA (cytosine(1402)-N(4))-methyltransferase RsmH [Acidobacteriota bacterium]